MKVITIIRAEVIEIMEVITTDIIKLSNRKELYICSQLLLLNINLNTFAD